MALGWSLLVQRSLAVIFFRLFRLVFIAVQRVYWELNGTARQVREASDPRYYDRSAQVLDVVKEVHFCEMPTHGMEEFICVHNRFENPQFVIDNEHITLYTITNSHAVFGVAKEKGAFLWKSEYNSFLRLAQRIYCTQLIIVPLNVFHKMAEKIGDPKAKMVFVFNTARCGSTLLTQIMEYTGRCVSMSEPDTPTLLATKFHTEGDTPEVRQLARDVIRWECRPYPSLQPLAYILKINSPAAVVLPLFKDLYPESRNLFMYRDIVKVSKSLYRMSYALPSVWLAFKLGRLSGYFLEHMINTMGVAGRDYRVRLQDDLQLGVVLNSIVMGTYLDLRRDGHTDIAAIRYEDLVSNPAESLRRILEYCRLPAELVEPGLRGLEVDSQRNSVIAKSTIGGLREPELTPEAIATANLMLKKFGLPLIGEECLIDGTITYIKSKSSADTNKKSTGQS